MARHAPPARCRAEEHRLSALLALNYFRHLGGTMTNFLPRWMRAAALRRALARAALADDYPTKPVRLIIPFPPGGSNDVVGRMVAQQLSVKLGQNVYVDNRGGAGGTIGPDAAAKGSPDGYTLLVISLAHAVNPWLYKLTYDPIKAFTPVAMFGSGSNVIAVNPDLPVHSVDRKSTRLNSS